MFKEIPLNKLHLPIKMPAALQNLLAVSRSQLVTRNAHKKSLKLLDLVI